MILIENNSVVLEPTTPGTPAANPICTAIASGDFDSASTWENGQIPSDICTTVIPSGFTVTFSGEFFNYETSKLTIGGTFIASSTTFLAFKYIINIVVEGSGSFKDQTTQQTLYFLAGSLFTLYSDASFTGTSSIAYCYTLSGSAPVPGAQYSFGASLSGPFTFGVLLSGEIQTFGKITCIAGRSGGFGLAATWLGGIIPTIDFCDSIDGCGLYIASGCDLDTSELNGELDINFDDIYVALGGTFSLGASGFASGFRFRKRFNFNIYGMLKFLSSSGGLYLPWGCGFNMFAGAAFSSGFDVEIRTYDPLTTGLGSLLTSIGASFSGSYFASISTDGTFETFDRATFVVRASGSLFDRATWGGGFIPTVSYCNSVGGCGLFIRSGCELSTSGIGDNLNVNFKEIELASGATFYFSSTAFRFKYPFTFKIRGTISLPLLSGSVYLPWGSSLYVYSGASFTNWLNINFKTYDASTGGSESDIRSFSSGFSGEYYVDISASGTITDALGGKFNCFTFISDFV